MTWPSQAGGPAAVIRALAAADNPAESDTATGRLLDYYIHTAADADRQFALWGHPGHRDPPLLGHRQACAPDLSTPQQAATWLEAERPNLHAAVDHAAAGGKSAHAIAITAAMSGLMQAHGYWDQSVALHQKALIAARQAGDRTGQGDTLTHLGILRSLTGDYPAAAASLGHALALFCDLEDRLGQAWALNQLGVVQQLTGDYQAATASQQQTQALFRDLGHHDGQAWVFNDLGIVQKLTGDYPASASNHQEALELFRAIGDRHGQTEGLNELGDLSARTGNRRDARSYHTQALVIARDIGAPLEEAHALEGIGQSPLHDGNPRQASAHLQQALAIYLRIRSPDAHRIQETLRKHEL